MSGGKKSYYPAIPRSKDPVKALPALTESLEILTGSRGDGLDKAVTRRELIATGSFTYKRGKGVSVDGGSLIPSLPVDDGNVEDPNLPEGVTVTGGFTFIMVEWNEPTFDGFAYAEVWRAATNSFGLAVRVTTTEATVYIDPVELESAYYYWVRFVNVDGVVGPIHATSGAYGATAKDINKIRAALVGAITTSQIASALNTRINLIDGGSAVPGSVNARIQSEASARANADADIVDYVNTFQQSINGNTASVQTLTTLTDGLKAQYMVKLDVNGYVSGFGLYNQGPGASGFVIHSDFFAIGKPGQGTKYPFIIGTVNGITSIVLDGETFIADATITTAKIKNLAVDSAKIADLSVGTAKIANAAVSTAKINDLAVTTAKIALLAVGSANITDAAITSAKIGDAQVSTLKIQGNAVTVPAGASIDVNTQLPNIWVTLTSLNVPINWGSNPPEAVMVIAFCNFLPEGSSNVSLGMRVTSSVGGAGGEVGVSGVNGNAVTATSTWLYSNQTGSCTYGVQVFASSGGAYRARGAGLLVIGLRR